MYAIEEQQAGWIIYVHGVAIMHCAEFDVALEIMQTAQERLTKAASSDLSRRQRRFIVNAPVSPDATAFAFLTDQPPGE